MTLPAISPQIFRAYDIRGIVGHGLTPKVMNLLGQAIGSEALDQGEKTLVVAADARLSSPIFSRAMIEGIVSTGCNVLDIGIVPTPLMYFATHHLETGSGVMITGSHNPGDYNGVKIVMQRQCLADNQIQSLQDRITGARIHSGTGWINATQVQQAYIKRITSDIRLQHKPRVVIDCGNGVAGLVAPDLFTALGCEVIPLYCDPDGHFPNHHPDPTVAKNLQDLVARVLLEQADLGIAFDGDGDRVGLVSSEGAIINADKMMMAFIRDILPKQPQARVVFDVKSSFHLEALVTRLGGEPVMCKSGHSFVKRRMEETGALLGGEFSAHIFFRHRWFGFDDGMYTAARFLELLDKNACSSQSLLKRLPGSVSTPELYIPVSDDIKFGLIRQMQQQLQFPGATVNTLDGLRADFSNGWGLIRASNTTPCLVLRFEAETEPELARIMGEFRSKLHAFHGGLPINF
ncbi:MAG: phosphomannomutase/phosphoglucomutase [Pseudohongiellaceae bacterium]